MTENSRIREGKPELLIPAKDLEVLRTAVHYGADAVYIGGSAFGLRAKARNFTREEMAEGIAYAHERGVRVHVTANILAHNADLQGAAAYFRELEELGPDAVLIADPGMFMLARENCPSVPVHISTQANNTNYATFEFWRQMGASRVVCARELSLQEIRQIRERMPDDFEIEAFIHGAMCISYSGRCLMSNFFTGRDANHGACTHPCRWKYALVEETRPGEYLPVLENERGTFIFNSRDLCMIEHIPELVEAGIDSFKIEGRMKTALYVASMARTYRKAIDDYFESEEKYRANMKWYHDQIRRCTYRRYTTGFYFGKPGPDSMVYEDSTYVSEAVFLGIVEETDPVLGARIMQRNKFSAGDRIEIMKKDGRDLQAEVLGMRNGQGEEVPSCPHARETIWLRLSEKAEPGDILRTLQADTSEDTSVYIGSADSGRRKKELE